MDYLSVERNDRAEHPGPGHHGIAHLQPLLDLRFATGTSALGENEIGQQRERQCQNEKRERTVLAAARSSGNGGHERPLAMI